MGFFEGESIHPNEDFYHSTGKLEIGKTQWGEPRYFDGLIEEVSIYDKALTPEEILNLYRKGVSRLDLDIYSCSDPDCTTKTSTINLENISNNDNIDISTLSNSLYLGWDAYIKPITELSTYDAGFFHTNAFVEDVEVEWATL